MKRVVITGIGIYSVLGKNFESVNNSLYYGKSGIGFDPVRKELGFRSGLTGIIERPILKGILPRRLRVGLAEQGEYAYVSTIEALKYAGIDEEYFLKNEAGILFGNDSSSIPVIEAVDGMREKRDTTLLGSGSIFQSMNSTVTMNLSVIFKLRGINMTISAACASGAHAIGLGYNFIRYGMQKMIICGGAQEVNAYSMGSFDGLSAFSIREDEPEKASRPFDADRDGLVPSGGAATVILEEYESAKKRGAPVLAEVIGYGFSSDGNHISVPNQEGPTRAMQMAIKNAKINTSEVDYINPHATSTPVGDANEAQTLHKIFGNNKKLMISATKSMTGHEMWMGGASEIIYSILMMKNDFVAPSLNFETPDEYSEKLNITKKTVDAKIDTVISNSFGFGGTNSTLIIRKI